MVIVLRYRGAGVRLKGKPMCTEFLHSPWHRFQRARGRGHHPDRDRQSAQGHWHFFREGGMADVLTQCYGPLFPHFE